MLKKMDFSEAVESNNIYKKIIPNYFTLLHTEAIKELIKKSMILKKQNDMIKEQYMKICSLEKRLYN
jgi:hypothetical protein